jgi:hypothetical protein
MKRRAILSVLLLAGCAKGHVETTQSGIAGPLPRPTEVAVFDFAISPDAVTLDDRPLAELMAEEQGLTQDQRRAQVARTTREALADTLTSELRAYGLPALRVSAGTAPSPGMLLVQGQILSVNQGNKRRRLLVGLGAGKSSATANAQLYDAANPAQPQLLRAFHGEADSGKMPGAAETMGAGAAAGSIATSAATTAATHAGSATRRSDDAVNADHLAQALARQITQYAVGQGWISASAVQ